MLLLVAEDFKDASQEVQVTIIPCVSRGGVTSSR